MRILAPVLAIALSACASTPAALQLTVRPPCNPPSELMVPAPDLAPARPGEDPRSVIAADSAAYAELASLHRALVVWITARCH